MTASHHTPDRRYDTEESILSIDSGDIAVYQDGPRRLPVLMLIHGTGMSARFWEPMVPLLTDHHRVIRIDLLGCGRSTAPEGASYAVEAQARRVAVALDRLGGAPAIIVGHSSGGVIATALVEQRPDLVTRLALIGTGPDMTAYIAKHAASAATSWTELTDDQIREAVGDAFHRDYRIPREFIEQVRDIDLRVFAATSQAIGPYLTERSLPRRLASPAKPLLVIFGDGDQRWSPSSADDYLVVPGATVATMSGVGHSPIIEDPASTAEHLLAFSRSLPGTAASGSPVAHAPGSVDDRRNLA